MIASALFLGCDSSRVVTPAAPPPAELPSNYHVRYDSLFQTPRIIENLDALGMARPGAPAPFSNAVAFQIVQDFVTRYATVFRLRPGIDDLVVTEGHARDGQNLVTLQQTYCTLPVHDMGYAAAVLSNRSIGFMGGRFMPDIKVAILPSVGATTARTKSVLALLPIVVHTTSPSVLEIATIGDVPRLAWTTIVASTNGWESWTVMVDAKTGTVLAVRQNFILN